MSPFFFTKSIKVEGAEKVPDNRNKIEPQAGKHLFKKGTDRGD
jgi:hypothetical protein